MPSKDMLIVIVTFGLVFVIFASLANGLSVNPRDSVTALKGKGWATVAVLAANFIFVPLLVGLTLNAFHFASQATMAFATLAVVAGAPFVAMFTKLTHGDVAFAGSISLVLLLVTIAYEPLVLPWLLGLLHVSHGPVTTWHLLKPLLWFILLPLGLGLMVRWRAPQFAQEASAHCIHLALIGIAVHVILMFVAFWDQVKAQLHTGEYIYCVALPLGCAIVGYLVYLLVLPGVTRAARRGMRMPAALSTAQKGSQALICSLIFAMGTYSVAGVVALGSSVITVVILVLVSIEVGRRQEAGQQPAAEATATSPAAVPAGATTG